jgi:DNA (cytosine-5)-methyltransferase 1
MSAIPKVLRVAAANLGQHKGHSRLYLQGKYLSKAGFKPAEKIKMVISSDSIELIVDESGTTTISRKVKGETVIPVIDILSDDLEKNLGNKLEVRVEQQKIVLKPNRIERAKTKRAKTKSEMTCGSLFCGGGLLSLAAKESGYTENFGIEINQRYADVYSDNFPESKILNQSIHEVNASDIPDVDLLLIGLPCEPFSTARRSGKGYEKGSVPESHELGDMVFWALRVIDILNSRENGYTKNIVIEEAPNFLKSGAGNILMHALKRMGYNLFSSVMDSNEYGSIQSRKRSVIVATSGNYIPPMESECTRTIADILETRIEHDWFSRKTESKSWLYSHWDKQMKKGNGFTKGLIKSSEDNSIQTLKKRYLAGQGDSPVLAHEGNTNIDVEDHKHRWFTLNEITRLFEVNPDYILDVPKTIAGEILGQGVIVGLFKQVIDMIEFSKNTDVDKCETVENEIEDKEFFQPLLFAM